MKLTDTLNLAWAGAVATAFIWITTTFATASEVDNLKLQILYGQFYDRLDDYEEELDQDDFDSAERLRRELLRKMNLHNLCILGRRYLQLDRAKRVFGKGDEGLTVTLLGDLGRRIPGLL